MKSNRAKWLSCAQVALYAAAFICGRQGRLALLLCSLAASFASTFYGLKDSPKELTRREIAMRMTLYFAEFGAFAAALFTTGIVKVICVFGLIALLIYDIARRKLDL